MAFFLVHASILAGDHGGVGSGLSCHSPSGRGKTPEKVRKKTAIQFVICVQTNSSSYYYWLQWVMFLQHPGADDLCTLRPTRLLLLLPLLWRCRSILGHHYHPVILDITLILPIYCELCIWDKLQGRNANRLLRFDHLCVDIRRVTSCLLL